MSTKRVAWIVGLCLTAVAIGYASENANMGTWKLNESKSKFLEGVRKNTTVVYSAASDDQVKVTTDGTEPDGKPSHTEWTGKFDGKDYPVTGDSAIDTRSYKRLNARTMELTNKKDGKVISTGRITLAPDGKSRTVIINATRPDGKNVTYSAVYDKE